MSTKLQVSGMHCGSCAALLERVIGAVPGVERATVDLRSETATVEGNVEVDTILAAIQDEGYQAAVVSG